MSTNHRHVFMWTVKESMIMTIAVEHLQRVFGLVGICPVVRMEDQGFDQLKKDVVAYMDEDVSG